MLAFMPRVLVVADVKPRPAIESARLHAAYVIRDQIFAEFVALVRAHPELIRSRTKHDANRVPDSPRENILPRPVRLELENAGVIRFGCVVAYVGLLADRDVQLFLLRRQPYCPPPLSTTAMQATVGMM